MVSMERIKAEHDSYAVASDVLSKGGVGSIHRTGDQRWVFKRYLQPDKAPDRQHLRQLVKIGRDVLVKQGRQPGQSPESSVNWPVDMALGRDGSVTGVVLPAIPPALFIAEYGKPRGLEFLIMARAHPPTAKGRVALLLRMAEILAFVNARGLVHGDVSGKNLAWTISPNPVMYLIDCDGMVPQNPPPTVGVQAMGWTDPRVLDNVIPAPDQYSDWYALALAMYRGLLLTPGKLDTKTAGGKWPAPSKIPDSLNPLIANLLHRALDKPLDARRRPSPAEWVNALVEEYLPGGRFRDSSIAVLDKVSAPQPARATFTTFPDADWTKPPSKPRTSPPRTARTRRAPVPPPKPARPVPPKPARPVPPKPAFRLTPTPAFRLTPTPPFRLVPPQPTPVRRPPVPRSPTIGSLAQRALHRGPAWHIVGLLACVYLPFIALPYIGVSWAQLRNVSSLEPRLGSARTALKIYGAIAGIALIIFVIVGLGNG